MENRIENFAELESALQNLQTLSQDITATLNETNSIYEEQKEGWYSATSRSESEKMMNYSEEAKKIAKNISEVSEAIQKFKINTQTEDERV